MQRAALITFTLLALLAATAQAQYTCKDAQSLLCGSGRCGELCTCVVQQLKLTGDAVSAGTDLCLQQCNGEDHRG